ncbi:MAG: phosphoglucomutase/phosphomannomutase family protein, partial [Candidatus Omnitrophota bacterium]|nr:phosphoglucomutase/phosphomannomutase family protein [Candidatus Omnitrophota bacterium]
MIKFGTDGWRGIIGDDFTFENLRIVSQALADYLGQSAAKNVAIGFDRRFLSDMFAREAARVLSANGLTVFLSDKPVTTPAVSYAVKSMELDAGVMITASHNPYMYNGLKIKGWYGGSAAPEMTAEIEKLCGINPVKILSPQETSSIRPFNPDRIYLDRLRSLVNTDIIGNSHLKVIFDPIFGSGSGYLDSLFASHRNIEVIEIHGEANPLFGGVNPEPIEQNLAGLKARVLAEKADIGI